jgi:hypothetical protein
MLRAYCDPFNLLVNAVVLPRVPDAIKKVQAVIGHSIKPVA